MDPTYLAENGAERERLRSIVVRLSAADLNRSLGDGWTIATALAHLAFWDRRQLAVLRRWQREGVQPIPSDPDTINEALHELIAALPPRTAAELALAAAEAVDRAVEQVTPEQAAEIEAINYGYILRRFRHRRAHLDQIEQALAA